MCLNKNNRKTRSRSVVGKTLYFYIRIIRLVGDSVKLTVYKKFMSTLGDSFSFNKIETATDKATGNRDNFAKIDNTFTAEFSKQTKTNFLVDRF